MTLTIRHGTIADTQACGQINYEAFKTVSEPSTSTRGTSSTGSS